MALDVFTCGKTDPNDVLKYIREEIDLGEVTVRQLSRFVLDESVEEIAEQTVGALA